ncbi:MAG: FAD-binding oxidoreductase [Candidatus Binatus sp.]
MRLPDSPLSLWLDAYGPYTPEPSLRGDIAVDVAVIGGGFTGIATACELRRADAALKVAVLEARTIGHGASGRNGSFAMTVVGLGFGTTAMIRGKQFLKEAHAFMERAVDTLDDLIQREKLDCDRIRPGFLRVATAPAYVARLHHEVELMKSLGFGGIDWIDAEAVRAESTHRVISVRCGSHACCWSIRPSWFGRKSGWR